MKNAIKIFLVLILTILITGCDKEKDKEKGQTDAYMFAEEYNSINSLENQSGKKYRDLKIPVDNPMIFKTAEEIVEMMNNKETFAVYFGFAGCPWCRSMIEQLIKSAKDNNQEKVYYVNVADIRDKYEINSEGNLEKTEKGSKGYNELIELMKDVLADYTVTNDNGEDISTGEKRIYAPNVVAVVNGKAEKMVEGTSTKLEDPYGELTDEMKEESYNSLKCIWECLSNKPICKKNAC